MYRWFKSSLFGYFNIKNVSSFEQYHLEQNHTPINLEYSDLSSFSSSRNTLRKLKNKKRKLIKPPLNGYLNRHNNLVNLNLSKFLFRQFCKNVKLKKGQNKKRLKRESDSAQDFNSEFDFDVDFGFSNKSPLQLSSLYQNNNGGQYTTENNKLHKISHGQATCLNKSIADEEDSIIESLTSSIYDFDLTG